MRRLLLVIACVCIWFAGCDSKPTTSGQDKSKMQPRRMMTPGAKPG